MDRWPPASRRVLAAASCGGHSGIDPAIYARDVCRDSKRIRFWKAPGKLRGKP